MDNRIFSVNGKGDDMLLKALELAFQQRDPVTVCRAWKYSPRHGLILLWWETEDLEGVVRLPAPLRAVGCMPMVTSWLASAEADKVTSDNRLDNDSDLDGDTGPGWRVYVDDCGYVDNISSTICAIRPVTLWYHK